MEHSQNHLNRKYKDMKKKIILVFLFCIVTLFTSMPRSFATAFNISIFDGGGSSTSALVNRGAANAFHTGDVLNFTNTSTMNATQSIGDIGPSSTALTLNGTVGYSNTINGTTATNVYAGFSVMLNDNYSFNSINLNNFRNSNGGAIYDNRGTIFVDKCHFTGNVATASVGGGAIYSTPTASATITNSFFNNNGATVGGGAVYGGGTISLSGNTFTSNGTYIDGSGNVITTARGGALYNDSRELSVATLTGNKFYNNIAVNGGAIYNSPNISTTAETNITGGIYSGNEATQRGGAIYNSTGKTTIQNASFGSATEIGNKAGLAGGAIYNKSDPAHRELTIINSSFIGNSVTGGSGGAIYNDSGGNLILTDSSFSNNSASVNGGAIYSDGGTVNINATGASVTFTGNTQAGTPNDIFMANSPTLNLNTNGFNITFDGGIQGAGIINKTGSNNLILDTNSLNTGFTGTYNNNTGKVIIKSAFFTGINNFANGSGEIQTNGSLRLNSGDSWTLTDISTTGGTLTLDSFSHISGGKYNQSAGALHIRNVSTASSLNLGVGSTISGGLVDFTGTGNNLNISGGAIDSAATLNLSSGNNLNVSGGTATLNGSGTGADTWSGNVVLSNTGTLTLDNFSHSTANGAYGQTGGTLNLTNNSSLIITTGSISDSTGTSIINIGNSNTDTNNSLTLSSGTLSSTLTSTTVNVGSGSGISNILNVSGGTLDKRATVNLKIGNNLNVSSGTATLNGAGTGIDTWAGTVNLTGGSLTLDGVTTNGIYTQTSGTGSLHLSNASGTSSRLTLGTGSTISAGTVDFVGTGNTLDVTTGGVFNPAAAINISSNNMFKVSGGTATLNGSGTGTDIWTGLVNVTGGVLTLDKVTNNATTTGGTYSQSNGTVNLINESSLTAFANTITGGQIKISSATATKSNLGLVYTADSAFNTNVQLQGNGTLTLETNGHTVTNTSETLITSTNTGNVLVKEGLGTYSYNLSGFSGNKQIDYGLNINKGTMNITGPSSGILTFGDTVNLGSGASNATLNLNAPASGTINLDNTIHSTSNSNTINVNATGTGTVNFKSDISTVTLNVANGITNLGSNSIPNTNIDNVAVNITGGTQNFINNTFKNNSRIYVNDISPSPAESTNFTNATFNGYSYTGSGAAIYNASGTVNISPTNFSGFHASGNGGAIYNAGTMVFSGGTYDNNTATNGGAVYNSGTATFTNTSFTGNTATANGGAIYNLGTLYLKADGSQITLTENKAAGISNGLYNHGTVYLNAENGGTIVFNDTVNSSDITTSTININAALGSSPLTNGTVYFNNNITNSTINLYNGMMVINNEIYVSGNNLGVYDGIINTQNNHIGTMAYNNATFTGISDWLMDVNLANKKGDTITTSGTTSGTLNISSINLLSDAKALKTAVIVADANTKNHLSTSVTSINSALFTYAVSYDGAAGALNFLKTGVSPNAVTSDVSQTQTFLLQTAIDRQFFGNVDAFMSFPLAARESTICCALAHDPTSGYTGGACPLSGNGTFSPIYSCDLNKGIWVKDFVSFENIPLNNGPNVSTIEYGTLIGADAPLRYLGHGIVGNTSAYVGYLGSNQNYNNVGVSQNGALVGLAENMVYKNTFLTLMASVGSSIGNALTPWGEDHFSSLFAGIAAKGGYNFEFKEGEYIIQPNLMLAYTFTHTPEYTTASGLNMNSRPLNAMQIAPGIRLIKNMRHEKGQVYLIASYVQNVMDKTDFIANGVSLPQLSIAPYIEYGIGYQRVWKERFTGFAQTLLRGGGRNGVALQFGLRWAI